ncbi:protein kinase domain-containing protein [Nannocystaceae bacterium ST9]
MELDAPTDVTNVDALDEDDVDADVSQVGDASWLRRGQLIGRYVIDECLGVGGMGIVYSAWDPKLDRKLAIKLVRARLGSAGGTRGRNRLMREAQALARVRHPNVITVHDVGAHEGRVFVAMEFIEGTTLQQWLEHERERPYRRLLDVFLQAGRGLAAAHRAGLVHRDFKPENVMIGNDGRVLVLDFGIARGPATSAGVDPADAQDGETKPEPDEFARSERVEDGMTRPGAIVGTPSYMSPEQRRSRPLDGRSDQFSYCVALWEALSGERPFGEGPAQKLLARMRLGQVRAMRRRDVPRRVIQALHRGLAWNRGDRFPSMEALLEALNPRGRRAPRLPIVLAGAALVVASAALFTAVLPEREHAGEPPTCTIDRARIDALWNPARAEQIAGVLRSGAGEQADSIWLRGHERIDAWTRDWLSARATTCEDHVEHLLSDDLHDRRVACLERQLDRFAVVLEGLATPAAIGSRELERVLELVGDLPEPERCVDDLALRERVPEPDSPSSRERLTELRAQADRLEVQFELAQYAAGIEPARQLVVAARELGHPPLRARALLILGNYLEREGVVDEAERVLLDAARTSASAHEPELEAEAIIVLAGLLSARGLHDEALRWLELAEGLAQAEAGRLSLRVSCANTRAAIAYRRGDLAAAEAGFEQARTLIESQGEPEFDLQLPLVLQNLAVVVDSRGDPRRALELHRRSLAIYERQLGPGHPRVALVRINLASALLATGEREAATTEYTRALALFEASVGPGIETAIIRSHLAGLHDSFGRCTQARELLDRALIEIAEAAPEGLEHASVLASRARVCDYADPSALANLDHAESIRTRLQDPGHLDRTIALIDRGLALLGQARAEEALAELERVRERVAELPEDQRARLDAATGLSLVALDRGDEACAVLGEAQAKLRPETPLARRVAAALAGLPGAD